MHSPVERQTPGDALVEQHAHRVQVRSHVDGPAAELLGRHVVGAADDDVSASIVPLSTSARTRLADAEIDELDHDVAFDVADDHDVVGLDVAVDDTGRVRRGQAGEQLASDVDQRDDRQLHLVEDVGERAAFLQLHHHVRRAVVEHAHVVDLSDVGMAERSADARFAAEPREHVRALLLGEASDFDRDAVADRGVLALVHGAVAARAEHALDRVLAADQRTDRQ